MSERCVVDTSALQYLFRIGQLDILQTLKKEDSTMNNREHPLIAAIKRTLADPGATRRMVLEQGKAFVYLSDDEQFIVTE